MTTSIASPTLVFIPIAELIILYATSFSVAGFVLYWWYRSYSKLGIRFSEMVKFGWKNWRRILHHLLVYAGFQKKILKDRYAGIMHFSIFYGMIILFISTALIALSHDLLKPLFHFGILVGWFYLNFEVWANLGGILLTIGIVMALYRRLAKRIELDTIADDYILLSGLLLLALQGFILGALKIYLFRNGFDDYRFVEWSLSYVFSFGNVSQGSGILLYRDLWMFHIMTAFAIAAYLPFSKLSHIALSSVGVSVKEIKPRGEMPTPFILSELMESGNFDFKMGAKVVKDLPKLKKIEALACTDCGRCERACPAHIAGSDLDPRVIVQNIKKNVYSGEAEMGSMIMSENAAWACTTCQACVEECPVLIEPFSFIMETRKNLVMESKLSKETVGYLNNLTYAQNPFNNPPSDRDEMLKFAPKYEEGMDILYWVGCMGAFDPRGKEVAKTVMELLNKAGVKYGILGSEEKCNGETARRIGEEGRFQELVLSNIDTFKKYNVKKILTACPHCFNTFKNEYPKFGLNVEVLHHSTFLTNLVKDGKLNVKKKEETVTLHDPCYLGRINGQYEETRFIVKSATNLSEMEKSGSKSMCCGAGGGNYWYKVESQESISHIRMEQALETKAEKLATACPFCMAMMEDASRTMDVESKIKVRDIAEILKENLA
ncbi:MAG: heterodisulfide reductase-related iron-sulfur binding cluster [Candidatus Thermoplasmatota archaeon]|jgi:Fe-S oxidoreductase/nitrate reductase gamma subunit|nr:heterodisulfide reductase-related iron-sulfur binding cluster [Candidatus Thermoplasmatota archaeon]